MAGIFFFQKRYFIWIYVQERDGTSKILNKPHYPLNVGYTLWLCKLVLKLNFFFLLKNSIIDKNLYYVGMCGKRYFQ